MVFTEWGNAAAASRGLENNRLIHDFGFVLGPGLFGFHLVSWIETYEALVATGAPPAASKSRTVSGNITAVTVAPFSTLETIAAGGQRFELWLAPGKPPTQGAVLKNAKAGVCGILAAGNVEAPYDLLSKMFGEAQVAVYKTHPNLANSTTKFQRQIFKKLIDDGYLAIVEGNVAPGQLLTVDPQVDQLLMTGGQATFDAIVWGRDVAANKAANKRAVTKPFDAELGAVSPWIIVPGQWTDAELKHHAEFLVACKMANAGAVCASPQAIIVDGAWPQLDKFQALVSTTAKAFPEQPIFYAGSCARENAIVDGTIGKGASVEWVGGRPVGDRNERNEREPVRVAVLNKVAANTPLVKTEAFAPVFGFVPIGGTNGDAKAFLKAAVAFANNECYGTLSGSLIIDPRTEAAIGGAALDEAIKDLKYGSIGINDWGGSAVFKGVGRWGAAPGAHTELDIQSGVGYIGNARLFDHAEKTVVYSPFVSPGHFTPPSEARIKVLQRMAWYAVQPTTFRLISLLSAALLNL